MEILRITVMIFGGLALFLFSISRLSITLKKIAGPRLKAMLQQATDNPVKGALAGTMVTFLVQSSSVTVLLLLGLVNAGLMNLRQSIYVILGSEIGTTITAQIVAFRVKMVFYPMLVAGFALQAAARNERLRYIGEILFSLGLIFLGMKIMADGSKPLQDFPFFLDLIGRLGIYPVFGIMLGAIFTAITNSSSATTSLVIAMSMERVINLPAGIALIIGANIGTCVLEMIAAAGAGVAARRTGMAQLLINLLGAVIFYPFLAPFAEFIALTATDVARHIANAHTAFNLIVSLIFMPLVGLLLVILERIVPGEVETTAGQYGRLEEKFLAAPALALYEAEEELNRMAAITEAMMGNARKAFFDNDRQALKAVKENEKIVDRINEQLAGYLARISTLRLSEEDSRKKRAFAHALTDIERVADLVENVAEYSEQQEAPFSGTAKKELAVFFDAAAQVYSDAVKSLKRKRKSLARDIYLEEDKIDELELRYRENYIHRLRQNVSRPAIDAFYPNVLQDLERISDHANNIAEHVLKM